MTHRFLKLNRLKRENQKLDMVLILAYGNSLRRDDGAGFVLAGMVERMLFDAGFDVQRIDSRQLEPEHALDISSEKISALLFIDTRAVHTTPDEAKMLFPIAAAGFPPPAPVSGTRSCLPAAAANGMRVQFESVVSADSRSAGIGHYLSPSTLLAFVAYLFKKQPPAWLITVPGIDFDHGEGLSDTARKAIDSAPEILRELIRLLPMKMKSCKRSEDPTL
ncbi:Ni,Fe-hydrogenase maturation factor (hox operon) [Syntrophobacter sp. SbD1]|nr:Ni,Fe-hydrogenase maturation factor (hox operon) [Syntrophobacter sp. SbD1]